MKYLFIHQNAPGQWRHIAGHLAKDPANDVLIMGTHKNKHVGGARYTFHTPEKKHKTSENPLLISFEEACAYGESAAAALVKLKNDGYTPDIICCHPGWGEGLFIKDVYPDVPYLAYTEFFYRGKGADVGFVPGSSQLWHEYAVRAKNARLILALEQADYCITPTKWQFSLHPQFIKDKTAIIHEGVRTSLSAPPEKTVRITLPDGTKLQQGDEVITHVGRNLEPYRGFPSFMRALPEILAARPKAHVVIVGAHGISYGNPPMDAPSWQEKMVREVPIDTSRVHFVGSIPHDAFTALLQITCAHVYLTFPFVLSWSMLEAMACEALIVGSATAPVMEVIEHGKNGLLVDFFSHEQIATQVIEVLEKPKKFAHIRKAARQYIIDHYDMDNICLPRTLQLLEDIVHKRSPRILAQQIEMPQTPAMWKM